MGLGKNRSIVGIYGHHQLVQFNNSPLVISLLAEESAPTGIAKLFSARLFVLAGSIISLPPPGMLMDLAAEIFDVTNPIVKAYEQSSH